MSKGVTPIAKLGDDLISDLSQFNESNFKITNPGLNFTQEPDVNNTYPEWIPSVGFINDRTKDFNPHPQNPDLNYGFNSRNYGFNSGNYGLIAGRGRTKSKRRKTIKTKNKRLRKSIKQKKRKGQCLFRLKLHW
jgi:hypothetical protein